MLQSLFTPSALKCRFALVVFVTVLLAAPINVFAQQQCGESADADLVVMIDKTGSIGNSELQEEK
ncbi:MAG: hypothetical protein KDD42_01955, partial [Bdellovibrionales bacterium]|nr:hypothetical protein [Bdellovibrionales bacterium]